MYVTLTENFSYEKFENLTITSDKKYKYFDPSVFNEDTEIEDFDYENLKKVNSIKVKRDIYKKKDLPYRKQFCTFEGCDAYFFVNWHLQRHLKKHTGEKPFLCTYDDCDKAFTCLSYLNKHLKTHNVEKKVRIKKTYECSVCKHVFKMKYNLKVHMYIHTGEKPYCCKDCDKKFVSPSGLRKHEKTHKGYKCNREDCDFIAEKWTILQKHVAKEHREKFTCKVCNKIFKESYNLYTHFKIHTGEKIKCSYEGCNRYYTTNKNLKVHEKTHLGPQFKCEYENCDSKFKHNKSLKNHILLKHSGKQVEKIKKPIIYTSRVSFAEKLSGYECDKKELENILKEDKDYKKKLSN